MEEMWRRKEKRQIEFKVKGIPAECKEETKTETKNEWRNKMVKEEEK